MKAKMVLYSDITDYDMRDSVLALAVKLDGGEVSLVEAFRRLRRGEYRPVFAESGELVTVADYRLLSSEFGIRR